MNIDNTEIQKIANLAYLDLSYEQGHYYLDILNNITTLFNYLKKMNTHDVTPMTNTLDHSIILHDDVSIVMNHNILSNAPNIEDNFFLVPRADNQSSYKSSDTI